MPLGSTKTIIGGVSTARAIQILARSQRRARDVVSGPGNWTNSDYQQQARSAWATSPDAPAYAVIEIKGNGARTVVSPFADKSLASDTYGRLNDNPGDSVAIFYFDRSNPDNGNLIDEAYYLDRVTATETETVTTKGHVWGWLAGLAGSAIVGVLIAKRKHH